MTKSSISRKSRRKQDKAAPTYELVQITSIDPSKIIDPFDTFPIDDLFYRHTGMIALTWSRVESQLNSLILALQKSQNVPQIVEKTSFKKRKELCKSLGELAFKIHPSIFNELFGILADAADLQWKRNFVLHGEIRNELEAVGEAKIKSTLFATSTYNNSEITLSFSVNDLENLFYRIANVSGRLCRFSAIDSDIPGFSFEETNWLHSWIYTNHPSPTISPKPLFQPTSFRK